MPDYSYASSNSVDSEFKTAVTLDLILGPQKRFKLTHRNIRLKVFKNQFLDNVLISEITIQTSMNNVILN